MKNHIAIKFVAILLCAAALLGAVGSGLGIFLLAEEDLYDKNVDQIYQEEVENAGRWFSNNLASDYASRELGGCPEAYLHQYGPFPTNLAAGRYSYALKDAEDNVLDALGEMQDDTLIHLYPVSGKYRHLVSAVPESQKFAPPETTELVIHCAEMGMDTSDILLTAEGETRQLAVTVTPEDTTDTIRYYSLNESVVTVNEYGLLTAVSEGKTKIIVTCGNLKLEAAVQFELPAPTTEATEPFQYDAWDDETWERIQSWIQEEWSKDTWENDNWEELAAWAAENWKEDEWNDDQWAQLKHWIEDEWNTEESVETTEATVSETEDATEPVVVAEDAPEEAAPQIMTAAAPVDSSEGSLPPETIGAVTGSKEPAGPVLINGRPVTDYTTYFETYYDPELGEEVYVEYALVDMPELTVALQLYPGAITMDTMLPVLRLLHAYRYALFVVLAVCLLLVAVFGVYLCCAAGRKPKCDEVRAGGLNRLPLELHGGLSFLVAAMAIWGAVVGGEVLVKNDLFVGFAFMAAASYVACLAAVGFLFALVAQLKTPGRFWLKNSLCGHCWRLLIWMWNKLFPLGIRLLKAIWQFVCKCLSYIFKKLAAIGKILERLYSMLPLVWQWLVIGAGLILIPLFFVILEAGPMLVLCIVADIALIIYGALAFGTLLDGTKRMSKGDLNTKVDDSRLIGAFKDFAHNLNALAGVALLAAQKQLKSERMKTELITNVSHDIKTPLTSIINYVDLLQKAETEEERAQYLEVLSRQSQQLKKLIEDLIEMSKASTGNMTVDITLVDAVEAVNQALGEFSDKLDKVQLTPVFRHSEEIAPMMADGKLVWRVLHNLLSNAVKYALPGTRLYIDLMQVEGNVILSMKNVSREELNVDADELMERFVRGDGSRNTEGSGLGLNIAKSMMELQKGQLELLVDGDLFKVTLIFPGV